MSLDDDVEEILLDSQTIASRVAELGAQLSADYAGRDPVLVSVLKGALIFLADLMRAMDLPTSIDLMEVSSYGAATETSGQVRILKDLSKPIEGRDVIVVEDIIDTGLTLNYLLKYLHDRGPRTVRICCLLDKPARRLTEIEIAYRGVSIEDRLVIERLTVVDERAAQLVRDRRELGQEPARTVADAIEIGSRVLDREDWGEGVDGTLRCAVGREAAHPDRRLRRRDVHDAAPARGLDVGNAVLACPEHISRQGRPHDAFPLLRGEVRQRLHRGAHHIRGSGIVDQCVELAEAFAGQLYEV